MLELDWDKCEIVEQFVKEILRIEGISDVIFYRICKKDHKIGDIKIKKDTIVNYSPYHLHHSEKYYRNPDQFDLTRFCPKNAKEVPRGAYLPFHEGQRGCAGIYLGKFMVKSVLLSLLCHFEVEFEPEFDPIWRKVFSLEMPSVMLKLRPRSL